jgi:putative ergosteryl-3beta-O-L-aspartate hydrolase
MTPSQRGEGDSGTQRPPEQKAETAEDKTGPPPSRSSLRISATWWRCLQRIGMSVHNVAAPRRPSPDLTKTIPSTLSRTPGQIALQIYLPKDSNNPQPADRKYPAVVNFHGGGFTLGAGTDDARFARFVLERCGAVFISADYRLAPEHPFPTAVDDCADAILYVARNARELRVDASRLATAGFSAGGNLAITALLRLARYRESSPAAAVPDYHVAALVAWYPVVDFTLTRAERRASAKRPDIFLPSALTNLFDASYLYPPDLDLADMLLSPAGAPDEILARGLPFHVILYTCEWDMLLREGERFAVRLENPPIGKRVHYHEIPRVAHGWDKGPSPMRPPERSEQLYGECCDLLKEIMDGEGRGRS